MRRKSNLILFKPINGDSKMPFVEVLEETEEEVIIGDTKKEFKQPVETGAD